MRDSSPRLKSKRAELLLEARARDARFAGDVEQLIEQVGVDARHLLALAAADRLASRRHGRGAARPSSVSARSRCERGRRAAQQRSSAEPGPARSRPARRRGAAASAGGAGQPRSRRGAGAGGAPAQRAARRRRHPRRQLLGAELRASARLGGRAGSARGQRERRAAPGGGGRRGAAAAGADGAVAARPLAPARGPLPPDARKLCRRAMTARAGPRGGRSRPARACARAHRGSPGWHRTAAASAVTRAVVDQHHERLELVAQVAHGHDAGHARAALEGVQRALESQAQVGAVRLRAPVGAARARRPR